MNALDAVVKAEELFKTTDLQRGSPKGAAQFFVPINEEWGIKFQQIKDGSWNAMDNKPEARKKRAKETFERQKEAAEYGLAPDVGDLIEVKIGSNVYYGYTTRRAQTYYDAVKTGGNAVDRFESFYRKHARNMLVEYFKATGIYIDDMKLQNAGIVDGKLVIIDFGDEGLSDYMANIFNEHGIVEEHFHI